LNLLNNFSSDRIYKDFQDLVIFSFEPRRCKGREEFFIRIGYGSKKDAAFYDSHIGTQPPAGPPINRLPTLLDVVYYLYLYW